MRLDEVIGIVTEAIQKKLVVEVDYIRGEDGVQTCRMMEPFDVAIGKHYKVAGKKFWGWCLYHNRMEAKTPDNIISIKITDKLFDPKIREATFSSSPNYQIPRNW